MELHGTHEPHCNVKCDGASHWLPAELEDLLDDDAGHAHVEAQRDHCGACA